MVAPDDFYLLNPLILVSGYSNAGSKLRGFSYILLNTYFTQSIRSQQGGNTNFKQGAMVAVWRMYQKIGSKGTENKLSQQSRHCTSSDAATSITTSITITAATTAIG